VLHGDYESVRDQLPLAYFDCVTMNDVLEHMTDPFQVLLSVKDLLAPGGRIVCSLPNLRYYPILKQFVCGKDFHYVDWGVLDRTHLRFFTEKSILRHMKELGFKVLDIKGVNGQKSLKFELVNALLLNSFSDARHQQIICVAEPEMRNGQ